MTQWFNPDSQMLVAARLVEVDGEWAISNDPALPDAGRVIVDGNGDLALVPGVGVGLPLVMRFSAPSVIVERD